MSTGPAGTVDVAVDGPVATITLDNVAKHNAMTLSMWHRVPEVCRQVVDSEGTVDGVKVVVLRGAGDKAFVAGADISQFSEARTSENSGGYNAATSEAYDAIRSLPMPTIAAVRGLCVGGGLALALCADIRVASDESRFGLPPAKLGLGYPQDGIDDVVSVVGPSVAKHLVFTADLFDCDTAMRWGLISQSFASEVFDSAVADLAGTIATRAPLTLRAAKLAVQASVSGNPHELERAAAAISSATRSADYREGVAAFMERRAPVFTGEEPS